MSHREAIELVRESMQFIVDFEGEMPGGKREECGNYLDHDVPQAIPKMGYPESRLSLAAKCLGAHGLCHTQAE